MSQRLVPPSWCCCRGMWVAREGTGLQGWRFGGTALHHFPSPSHATGLQSSFLSPTRWLLRQEESKQGADGKWGAHLTQQQWLFGNATPVAVPAKSCVLIDLNLLRVTQILTTTTTGQLNICLDGVHPAALAPMPPLMSPRCHSAQPVTAVSALFSHWGISVVTLKTSQGLTPCFCLTLPTAQLPWSRAGSRDAIWGLQGDKPKLPCHQFWHRLNVTKGSQGIFVLVAQHALHWATSLGSPGEQSQKEPLLSPSQ